jgi:hypothetical protein
MKKLLVSFLGLLFGFLGVFLCTAAAAQPLGVCDGCLNQFSTNFSQDTATNDCDLALRIIADTSGCGGMGSDSNGTCATTEEGCSANTSCKFRKLLQYSSCCNSNVLCWNCGNQNCCPAPQTTSNCGTKVWASLLCIPGLNCLAGEVNCGASPLECVATLVNDTVPPEREAVSLEFVASCTACVEQ